MTSTLAEKRYVVTVWMDPPEGDPPCVLDMDDIVVALAGSGGLVETQSVQRRDVVES